MKRELILTHDPITESAPQMSDGMGAAVTFHGVVRDSEDGEAITAIDYEANEEMARHQFGLIFDALEERWPVESVRLVHRLSGAGE
jgi:molybdopterin synthase catalytic subunit